MNLLSTAVALTQPYLTKLLIDQGLIRRNFGALELYAIWMGVIAALSLGLGVATTLLYTKLSASVLFDMRLAAFRKLQNLSPQFYAGTKTGEIVSRINNDIGELQRLSSDTLLSLPSSLLFLIGNGVMMFYLDVKLSLLGLALLPFGVWAMQRYQGRLRQKVQLVRESSAAIGSFLIEAILGMRSLVSFNAQERKSQEFRGQNDRFVKSLLSMQVTSFLAGALPGAVLTLSVSTLFLYGGHLIIAGALTLGGLMAFMAYHGRLLAPVQGFMASYSALIAGSVSLSRVFELLDAAEEVVERPNAVALRLTDACVRFESVWFGYRGRGEILRNVTFDLPAFATSVIVGASGAGKSTLADLLMRFYDPSSGEVKIGGRDLRDMRLTDLRAAVAVVEQTPFFFHSSIRENLMLAAPAASFWDLQDAVKRVGMQAFIESLPAGYETVLGERGLALSAGQRQRLAIARALLRRPLLLILDEPSAALDPQNEWALMDTLRELRSMCTILIATHRAALVQIAQNVVVLENGCVSAQGRPQDLQVHLAAHFRNELALPSFV